VSKTIGWDRGLSVQADGKGLVGHAGAVLLRRCADKTGLTSALSAGLARRGLLPGWDRGVVLGAGASDSTLWRALGGWC
jgi:hypothetical protein